MKTATMTLLALLLVLPGALQVQAEDRNEATDMSPTMKHGDRGMLAEGMGMQPEDKAMPPAAADMMQPNDAMKGEQTMLPSDAELRQRLTPLQYRVTRENGTEPPFDNAYWNNHEPGIYVDIISGAALFSSTDKYTSGTGWPSFTRPIHPDAVVEKEDRSFFSVRTEIRGKRSDAHLGHVFDDGPPPTGLRYCMNSAALRFVPQADLAKEGYAEYEKLFK